MPRLTLAERKEILYTFALSDRNAEKTAKLINVNWMGRRKIWRSTVVRVVKKFEDIGSLQDKRPTGRPRSTTDDSSACRIIQTVNVMPGYGIHEIANRCGTTFYAVQRVLKEKKFKPYKERQLHVLTENDYLSRARFCQWFLQYGDPRNTLFTDEAMFYIHGRKSNAHYWAKRNPRRYSATCSNNKTKVIVWAGIFGSRIIGPYFFNQNVTSMLHLFLIYDSIYLR